MTLYALGVVGHQEREKMAHSLSQSLGATVLSVDPGHIGPGSNHRRVWAELAIEDTTWSVVLEDDALPVNDFREQLDQVLRAAPAAVVSLYLGQQRPPQYQDAILDALKRAEDNGSHWITSNQLLHAVGVAMRTELVDDMLTKVRGYLPIDQAIGRWARQRGHEISYCRPSLCDHLDGPTLIKHPDGSPRLPGRVAWEVGSRTEWNSRSVNLNV